jgi:hypothetical protein
MLAIHASCVKYGSDTNGYVDYVKGANILVCKVADAMLAQGWCKIFLDIKKAFCHFGQKALDRTKIGYFVLLHL